MSVLLRQSSCIAFLSTKTRKQAETASLAKYEAKHICQLAPLKVTSTCQQTTNHHFVGGVSKWSVAWSVLHLRERVRHLELQYLATCVSDTWTNLTLCGLNRYGFTLTNVTRARWPQERATLLVLRSPLARSRGPEQHFRMRLGAWKSRR